MQAPRLLPRMIALFALTLLPFLGGCGVRTYKMDKVPVKRIAEPAANAPRIRITRVTDHRQFAPIKTKVVGQPVMKKKDLATPDSGQRIVGVINGNKPTLFYQLPQEQTVVLLATQAAANAFRGKGYTVVTTDDPTAMPVELDIQKFWYWIEPGFWTLKVNCDILVDVKSSALASSAGSDQATCHTDFRTPAILHGNCGDVFEGVLDGMRDDLNKKLKPAAAGAKVQR
jgi:hypothetical protein